MTLDRRTPKECFDAFRSDVSALLSAVLGERLQVRAERRKDSPNRARLVLYDGGSKSVKLDSRAFGPLYFNLEQDLAADLVDGGLFRLATKQYWYRIYEREPDSETEPLFRWEYNAEQSQKHCKRHFHVGKVFKGDVQVPIQIKMRDDYKDLSRLHIPTGFTLFEHVLRFLLADLEVVPACGDAWGKHLDDSEAHFFRELSPKTSTQTAK